MSLLQFDKTSHVGFLTAIGVFLVIVIMFTQLSVFDIFETASLDFRFFLRDPSEKSEKIAQGVRRSKKNENAREDIVILGIDENTIRDFSDRNIHWPFPWSIHATFINYVSSGNPLAVLFDITLIDHKEGEKELAAAFRRAGNVFIDYPFENVEVDKKYTDQNERINLLKKMSFPIKEGQAVTTGMIEEIVPPIPELLAVVKGAGFANVFPDAIDDIIREMPLILAHEDTIYPNIDLAVVMHYFGIGIEDVEIKYGEYIKLKNLPIEKMKKPNDAREIIIPINMRGAMDVNYIGGPGSFNNYPYSYFAQEGTMANNDSLKDKIVLVAAYSVTGIATDLHKSPYGTTFGIEHHANALNTILNQDFLSKMSATQNILIMLFLAIVTGFFLPRISIVKSAIFTVFICLAYLVISYLLFSSYNIINAMLTPVLQVSLTFTVIGTVRVLNEQKEKRYIRQTFSKFVSKSVVDDLLKHPDKLKLGGEKKIISVLFSDIRGFTSIAEQLPPEELVEHLNIYLQAMTDLVFEFDGTLDKYVGDEIMAFWGAPMELENHALNACRCAVKQMEALYRMNENWRAEGKPELNIGIGINTGDVVVGNMGSSSRMDYTLMGDNVNLGARLEGTNKVYGTGIIISEYTYNDVKDYVIARELDLIRVKGKAQPVKIYELLDVV